MNNANTPGIQSITGEINSVRTFGTKGWATAMLLRDGQMIRCTGTALSVLKNGTRYNLTGKFIHHPRYGLQFDVRAAEIDLSADHLSLTRHIAKHFKGIGPKTAGRIVAAFESEKRLDYLRDQLVYSPECLDFSGYTKRPVEFQGKGGFKDVVTRDFSVRLKSIHEVHTGIINKLGAFYAEMVLGDHPEDPKKKDEPIDPAKVAAAWKLFAENPFEPLGGSIRGYGFKAADASRRYLGIANDAPCRLAALVSYVLRQTCEQSGHTYLTHEQMLEGITLLDPNIDPTLAIQYALHSHDLKIDGQRYYPFDLAMAEEALAKRLALRRATPVEPIFKGSPDQLDGAIQAAEISMGKGFQLDDTQRAAVRGMLLSRSSIHTLTAGPGCGKTAIMELIARIVHRDATMRFCAPTGKAAKVLRSRINHIGNLDALTIHAMLVSDGEGGFEKNEGSPLDATVLVVDETSMLELVLTNQLFSAVKLTSHIVLLGDTQQLPSIGPGDILHDLLRIQGFDHYRLNRTHRNTGGILDVIMKAGAGVVDGIDREDVTFRGELPDATPEGFASVIADYDDALRQENDHFASVGLIIPKRKGDIHTPGWNVTYLNHLLRTRYNPDGAPVPGTTFFVNDRVLIRKNQILSQMHRAPSEGSEAGTPTEVVVNGDTGTIASVSMINEQGATVVGHIMINLDDGRKIYYPGKAIDDLDHAYAITCHAAQGSEYRRVIFLCTDGPRSFMNRSIVFTALSRAKINLKIWGALPKLQRICRHTRLPRNSALIENAAYLYRQLI